METPSNVSNTRNLPRRSCTAVPKERVCGRCGGYGETLDPEAPGSKKMVVSPCEPCGGKGYL